MNDPSCPSTYAGESTTPWKERAWHWSCNESWEIERKVIRGFFCMPSCYTLTVLCYASTVFFIVFVLYTNVRIFNRMEVLREIYAFQVCMWVCLWILAEARVPDLLLVSDLVMLSNLKMILPNPHFSKNNWEKFHRNWRKRRTSKMQLAKVIWGSTISSQNPSHISLWIIIKCQLCTLWYLHCTPFQFPAFQCQF